MDDLEVAVAAAQAGGEVVRGRFATALSRVDKGAMDFATDVDLAAERAILAVLREHRPADAVLAEESGQSGVAGATRRWMVDPLCGTANFAAQTALVAVNVALAEDGGVRTAAAADPFTGELFTAGGGVAQVRCDGKVTRLAPDAGSRLVDLDLDPPFPSAPTFRAVALAADAGFAAAFRPRVISTSLALLWVAAGRRAAYLTDGDLRDNVHFAAGLAISEQAGCVLSDLRGEPVGSGPGLIAAADAETHAALLALVRAQRGARPSSVSAAPARRTHGRADSGLTPG